MAEADDDHEATRCADRGPRRMTRAMRFPWRSAVAAVAITVSGMASPLTAADAKVILLLHTYGYEAPGRLPFDAALRVPCANQRIRRSIYT